MQDDLVQVFCDEYKSRLNQLRSTQKTSLSKHKSELAKLKKERANIIQAIKDGVPEDLIKDELEQTSTRQGELKTQIEDQSKEVRPLIHPAMGQRYRKAVNDLRASSRDGQGAEAKQHVRALIE
ncbi:MAG: hypothetical protein GY799_12420 [Desulfobulbaceae bacterium]|nr:hypothetical protein [Desulfobulbaceae bacterium]